MSESNPAMAAALNTYTRFVSGNRPKFVDDQPGKTTIQTDQGSFSLLSRPNGYSVQAQDGTIITYDYDDDGVKFTTRQPDGSQFGGHWQYRDPANYKIGLSIGNSQPEITTDHNHVVPAIGKVIDQLPAPLPKTNLHAFFYWLSISEDFKFEFARRVRGQLPTGYFKAIYAARLPNFGCAAACVMCALALETGPFDFWCALCLICIPSGGVV